MNENIFLAAFFFPAAAAVLVFLMKYVSVVLQARVRLGQEEAYRELAAKAAEAQSQLSVTLSTFGASLAEINSQLAAVRQILQDVG